MATGTAIERGVIEKGGLLKEDVLPRLFKITPVERPFIDAIGVGPKCTNVKKEFTDKVLASPSATNAYYENQALTSVVSNTYGLRYGNYCQQMIKVVKMSQRGRDVDNTYAADEYLQQIMDLGMELRRDEEAAAVSRNPARAEVSTTPPLMAGAATWAIRNTSRGASTGADAVLDGSTGVGGFPTTAPVAGTGRGFTETLMRAALRNGWDDGARFDLLMSTGLMIENIANYMFTSSARVATLMSDAPQSNRSNVRTGGSGVVAQGAVNMFIGNFGAVKLVPNMQMTEYSNLVDVLFVDTRYPQICYLHPYSKKALGVSGLYEQEALYVDCTMIPGSTYAITTVSDIDPDTAMTS
jgi:hypothetical protein